MIPAVAFVGPSQAGKTTLVEKLIAELKSRDYRVATVKHSGHGVSLDTSGKDSWRYYESGSDAVIVASEETTFWIRREQQALSLEQILSLVGDCADLALVEGFKQSGIPKIEVHRKAMGCGLTCAPETLVAVATDEPLDVGVPQLDLSDSSAIADFIVQRVKHTPANDVQVMVNGRELYLKPFMKLLVARTILGMMSTMKGTREIRSLDISVRNCLERWGSKYEGWRPDD